VAYTVTICTGVCVAEVQENKRKEERRKREIIFITRLKAKAVCFERLNTPPSELKFV